MEMTGKEPKTYVADLVFRTTSSSEMKIKNESGHRWREMLKFRIF